MWFSGPEFISALRPFTFPPSWLLPTLWPPDVATGLCPAKWIQLLGLPAASEIAQLHQLALLELCPLCRACAWSGLSWTRHCLVADHLRFDVPVVRADSFLPLTGPFPIVSARCPGSSLASLESSRTPVFCQRSDSLPGFKILKKQNIILVPLASGATWKLSQGGRYTCRLAQRLLLAVLCLLLWLFWTRRNRDVIWPWLRNCNSWQYDVPQRLGYVVPQDTPYRLNDAPVAIPRLHKHAGVCIWDIDPFTQHFHRDKNMNRLLQDFL